MARVEVSYIGIIVGFLIAILELLLGFLLLDLILVIIS